MNDGEILKSQIRDAFASVEYPGDGRLRDSSEGDEPILLEQEFTGKTDWRTLDAEFIDHAPDGYCTALCFFSDEAFHFYLPAYLIADIDGLLQRSDPVFHLRHGLDDESAGRPINPRRYGQQTWSDYVRRRFSAFSKTEAAAIVAYLQFVRVRDEIDQPEIDQALNNYWLERAT